MTLNEFVQTKEQLTFKYFVETYNCMYELEDLQQNFKNVYMYNDHCYILEYINGGYTFDDFTKYSSIEKCEKALYNFCKENLYF